MIIFFPASIVGKWLLSTGVLYSAGQAGSLPRFGLLVVREGKSMIFRCLDMAF
jgi:hypothetical protein